jgi:hypothetical protein
MILYSISLLWEAVSWRSTLNPDEPYFLYYMVVTEKNTGILKGVAHGPMLLTIYQQDNAKNLHWL